MSKRFLVPLLSLALVGGFAGTAQAATGAPFGNGFDRAEGVDGGIRTRGWAIDPDTSNPVQVRVAIDGTTQTLTANQTRPDVENAFPGYGAQHGWDTTLATRPGDHQVCVAFVNVAAGTDTDMGCRTVRVGGSPFGTGFDRLEGVEGGLRIKGWAIDPDTDNPVTTRVSIDGTTQNLTANATRTDVQANFPGYGAQHGYDTTLAATPGDHQVCVTFANIGYGTDTSEGCRTVTVPTAVLTVAAATTPSRPGATNTGVPAGTRLTAHYGDLVVSTPGAVIDSLDVYGVVRVQADNVTIKNTRVRGRSSTYDIGLVVSTGSNLRVVDSEIAADTPSPYMYGVRGWGFTLERVNIHHVIDGVHSLGSNVTVRDSWIHDTLHFANDPNHSDGSHDDGIQIQVGSNIRIVNNTIEGAYNAAIMITQDRGNTSDVQITGNWINGGGCSVNIAEKGRGPIEALYTTNNVFGRDTRHYDCAIVAPTSTPITAQNNHYVDGAVARVKTV